MAYRMCFGDYAVTVNYNHSDDGNSRSFVEIFAPAHDINRFITSTVAENALIKCGGKLNGPLADNIVFRDIEDSGTLYPSQTRLYLTGNVPNAHAGVSGASATKGGQGGVFKSSNTYVDLETGKCFVTTTAVGI